MIRVEYVLPPYVKSESPKKATAVYEWTYEKPNPFIISRGKKYNKDSQHAWTDLVNSDRVITMVSGPELELIKTHFQNIPWVISQRSACDWTGEMAKFIALNFDFRK